uniref:G-patch domain-containing protein n=1 Tax=Echinococcus canadensis TaxID=519352 RepID=A0A915EYY8_9CEST
MAFINPKRMGTYTLTPTGASIAEDESNVGQQILKKMGWAPETGIGKNRNGIVEPVKSLAKHKSSVVKNKSRLEEKSKQSRSRVHYGKFVRAKDVSQYSRKSLKIILGASVDKTQSSPENDAAFSAPEDSGSRGTEIKQEFGVKTYSSSTDLASYFSLKRSALKPSTEDLPKRKRARFTPTSDEGRGEKPSFAGATPELPHDDSDDKEIPRSSKPTVFEAEPHESDSDEPPTEAPVEIKEEPTRQRSAAFSTSNVHSLPGYPFY